MAFSQFTPNVFDLLTSSSNLTCGDAGGTFCRNPDENRFSHLREKVADLPRRKDKHLYDRIYLQCIKCIASNNNMVVDVKVDGRKFKVAFSYH